MQDLNYTWKGREPSVTASQLGNTKNGRSGKLRENPALDFFHGGCERQLDPLLEKGGDRADPLGEVAQELAILSHTPHQGENLLHIPGYGPFDQCGHWFCLRT